MYFVEMRFIRKDDEESREITKHFSKNRLSTNWMFKARPDLGNRIETRPGFSRPPRYPWIESRENERDF